MLELQCKPNRITAISNDKKAVLSNSYQIQVVSTGGKLTLERTVKTNGDSQDVKNIYLLPLVDR